MTLSKFPVFGNYIHSEPKFIGVFPDRKDYPFNTGTYGTTLMDEKPVKKEAPETFKIGDRVKTAEDVSCNLGNYYGIVTEFGGSLIRVSIPYLNDRWWFRPEQLKKEFAVGDKVTDLNYSKSFGTVRSGPDASGYFTVDFPSSTLKTWYDQLTYVPEEKKSGDDLTIVAGGTAWGPVSTKAPTHKLDINKNGDSFTINPGNGTKMNSFVMNQPILLDNIPKSPPDVHSYSIKFITAEGDDHFIGFDEGHTNTSMKKVFEKCYGSQTTYSATIVLASGRVVNIPNPNEKDWTLKNTEKVTRIEPVLLDHEEWNEDVDEFVLNSFVEHEEGKCWLKDMARIIEQKDVVSPFETKFSYVTEIRKYVRKPIEKPAYECTMPALRCLW